MKLIVDINGSDSDDQMDTSLMEPQLMLDEYDEPVEFKYDPNTDSTHQQDNTNYIQQQSQYKQLVMAAEQHRQQLQQLQAVAKGGAVIGVGPQPGTVTISNASNTLVSIPKLTPILKQNTKQMPKLSKRPKLKQNGLNQADQQVSSCILIPNLF